MPYKELTPLLNKKSGTDCGVLFSTYSCLISGSRMTRIDQLVKWCGEHFDGCLVFDECHKVRRQPGVPVLQVSRHRLPCRGCFSHCTALAGAVFDTESPQAKNLVVGNDQKSSRTARHVAEVQRRLPRARVVYVSATGASELSHMSYMDRLGL
jgi:transposase